MMPLIKMPKPSKGLQMPFAVEAHISASKERKQTVKTAFMFGDTTVLTIQFDAVVAIDLPKGWKAGQTLDFRGASAFQLRDGKIMRITDQS